MEKTIKKVTGDQVSSIWGEWWHPYRKIVYPGWLGYELTVRIVQYCFTTHYFFQKHSAGMARYIGNYGVLFLDIVSIIITIILCEIFLTIPACYILYDFFQDNAPNTRWEKYIKKIL